MGVPPRREIEAEERLLREPLYQELRPRVIELIDRLQQAATVEDWVDLHRDLLVEFGGRQDAADQAIPAAKQKVAAEMAELAGQIPKPTDLLREQQQILDRIKMQSWLHEQASTRFGRSATALPGRRFSMTDAPSRSSVTASGSAD